MNNLMPPPESDAILCLYRTALACMLPFFIAGAQGDAQLASNAILEMVSAYRFATAIELDLVGRIITFSAAAMDSLRLSMQPDLSDAKISKYRAAAVTLNRTAEECRKTLQAIQLKREQMPVQLASSSPKPVPAPPPMSPPHPAAPRNPTPPAQPKASADPLPVADDNDQIDIETLRLSAHALLADLRAMAELEDVAQTEVPHPPIPPNPSAQANAAAPA